MNSNNQKNLLSDTYLSTNGERSTKCSSLSCLEEQRFILFCVVGELSLDC